MSHTASPSSNPLPTGTPERLASGDSRSPGVAGGSRQQPAYLPPPAAANYLQVSERYLASLRKRRVLPCIRLGRRCVRYSVADLDAAMLRFRRAAVGEGVAS
jgi:hypothetical protein